MYHNEHTVSGLKWRKLTLYDKFSLNSWWFLIDRQKRIACSITDFGVWVETRRNVYFILVRTSSLVKQLDHSRGENRFLFFLSLRISLNFRYSLKYLGGISTVVSQYIFLCRMVTKLNAHNKALKMPTFWKESYSSDIVPYNAEMEELEWSSGPLYFVPHIFTVQCFSFHWIELCQLRLKQPPCTILLLLLCFQFFLFLDDICNWVLLQKITHAVICFYLFFQYFITFPAHNDFHTYWCSDIIDCFLMY